METDGQHVNGEITISVRNENGVQEKQDEEVHNEENTEEAGAQTEENKDSDEGTLQKPVCIEVHLSSDVTICGKENEEKDECGSCSNNENGILGTPEEPEYKLEVQAQVSVEKENCHEDESINNENKAEVDISEKQESGGSVSVPVSDASIVDTMNVEEAENEKEDQCVSEEQGDGLGVQVPDSDERPVDEENCNKNENDRDENSEPIEATSDAPSSEKEVNSLESDGTTNHPLGEVEEPDGEASHGHLLDGEKGESLSDANNQGNQNTSEVQRCLIDIRLETPDSTSTDDKCRRTPSGRKLNRIFFSHHPKKKNKSQSTLTWVTFAEQNQQLVIQQKKEELEQLRTGLIKRRVGEFQDDQGALDQPDGGGEQTIQAPDENNVDQEKSKTEIEEKRTCWNHQPKGKNMSQPIQRWITFAEQNQQLVRQQKKEELQQIRSGLTKRRAEEFESIQ